MIVNQQVLKLNGIYKPALKLVEPVLNGAYPALLKPVLKGDKGDKGAAGSAQFTYEWPALTSNGAINLALPVIPSYISSLRINGLAQSRSEINAVGNILNIAASLNTMAGDIIAVDYVT